MSNYTPRDIEEKWQKYWSDGGIFQAGDDEAKPGYYVLEMFPYPSGRIHMGHLRNYTIGDVIARFKLAQGYDVLHPMGWDAFGLPAENAAIQNNIHPTIWTRKNIDNMRAQLKSIGLSYDWDREFATCDPDYYRHEQKMFLDFLENGIAYQKESYVNWDPVDQTVLANEQVIDGKGWRSGAPVERKKLNQWFLRITDFADELLDGLKGLQGKWPERVLTMQENWIGKSMGAKIFFAIKDRDEVVEVFTTRPDTLFGASFCAISPNHPLAERLAKDNPDMASFIKECNKQATSEAALEKAEKQGFNTGLKIKHPFMEGRELPLYIANFVLMEYGTGAVFGCPAHDQRDLDFANKYGLPVRPVVAPEGAATDIGTEAYTGPGVLCNSEFLDGLSVEEAKKEVCRRLEKDGLGEATTIYRLRDWGVSRQRYWGCPIPVIYCEECGVVPVPEADLPVTLPEEVSFDGQGNPLVSHPEWKYVACPTCGKEAERETDTFDTFFESSWYFARYCDARNERQAFDSGKAERWLPVDQYIGGIEHAVLHLLYARFFTRALKHCGYFNVEEPFAGLLTQGMVCHQTFQAESGEWLYPDEVEKRGGAFVHKETGKSAVAGRIEKMSKSKKNTVDPEGIIRQYGADTARLFMLSDSPPERDLEWSDAAVEGSWKYLKRLYAMIAEKEELLSIAQDSAIVPDSLRSVRQEIHRAIADVTEDIGAFRLNKAVARIRELTNTLSALKGMDKETATVYKEGVETVIRLFSPMIPHICEELWRMLGHTSLLATEGWPEADPALLKVEMVTVGVQVNGKLRATVELGPDENEESARNKALAEEGVQRAIDGKEIRKIIVVPGKIINVVAA